MFIDYFQTCGTRVVSHHLNQRRWPQTKIIGGSSTPYGAYPWQVQLFINIPNTEVMNT